MHETVHDYGLEFDDSPFDLQSPLEPNPRHQTKPNYKSLFHNPFDCITAVCRVDYDLQLQKLPLPSVEGPRTAERSHEGTQALIGSHTLSHRISANREARAKQNSYRSGPVTQPPGWERSECKGLEAVKDKTWNFKH